MDILKKNQRKKQKYLLDDIEQDRAKPSYEVLIKICNLFNIGINQIFSEYLKIQENKTLKYSLAGFEKLNKKDKETIENLIMYFNKNQELVKSQFLLSYQLNIQIKYIIIKREGE